MSELGVVVAFAGVALWAFAVLGRILSGLRSIITNWGAGRRGRRDIF